MPSVNIGELRDTRRLKARLRAGKTAELRERQQVIGRIVPAHVQAAPEHWPDFSGRRHKIIGKRTRSGADLPIEDRGARPLLRIYADTSFFVSLNSPDLNSPEAERRMASKPWVWLTPLHLGRMDPCSSPACFPQGDLPCARRAW